MPDRVVEFRCPTCAFQIPLLAPGNPEMAPCPECGADPAPAASISGVDSTGLLNLLLCRSCGRLLGRSWGLLGLPGSIPNSA